ncbi:MAG: T9SS type A sorting domain-containing protein [Algibacter sp.]
MKNQLLFYFLFVLFAGSFLQAQPTSIPDANFEKYLETHTANGEVVAIGNDTSMGDGVDNNQFVLTSRIQDVISLNVGGLEIEDLTGIAGFVSLESLICSGNKLTNIDLSSNLALKSILCGDNLLTNLNLESNSNLESINCSNNRLQSLELINPITLGVYHPLLKSLSCSANQISDINVTQNTDLTLLSISNNNFSNTIDLSNNLLLENLFCASNKITNLDVSLNVALINFDASANKLTTLNISNGANANLVSFNSEDNSELNCIQIDNGFTPSAAWQKDEWSYYSDNACADAYTYVPDDNFEDALIALGHDSGTPDNFVLTSTISVLTDLPINGEGILDLTGIEDFVALTTLDCSNNDLTVLDLSDNINLTTINCSANILPSLDVSANIVLENLDCSFQQPYDDIDDTKDYTFDSLNVNSNTALLALNCSNNNLTTLDISNNTLLTNLDCSFNSIEALNISVNGVLTAFSCNDNELLTLNLKNGNNGAINPFNADVNPNLSCIEVDAIPVPATGWTIDANSNYSLGCGTYVPDDNFETYLETHDVAGGIVPIGDAASMGDGFINNFVPTASISTVTSLNVANLTISDLTGIEDFLGLLDLNCSANALTSLDLSNNTALTTVDCSSNTITDLDFSLNTALTTLDCNDNNLFSLNIKNVPIASFNQFDVTMNSNLYCIEVDDEAAANAKPIIDWIKDDIADYSMDCQGRFTAILDDNFEQALIDLGIDSGALDDQVLTSNIEHLLNLDVSDYNIEDLEGIKAFASLNVLNCSENSLSKLDVSNMINLERLDCGSNYLLANNNTNNNGVLNLDGVTNLEKLYCAGNILANLDVSQFLNLDELNCSGNEIEALDVSVNTQLKELICSNNNIASLDISANTILEEVDCDNNQISSFTSVGVNNSTLIKLNCAYNNITNLDVDNYLALETFNCRNNQLPQLDLTLNTALVSLDFTSNAIVDIDLASNINLVSILASQNNLTELDLSTNTVLKTLNCDNNQISNLTTDGAAAIKYMSCSGNQLTDLDLSNNTNLIDINVSFNLLSDITLGVNLSNLKTFNCSNNNISNLDLSTMGTAACPPVSTDPNNPQDFCPPTITINVSSNLLSILNIQNTVNSDISSFIATNNPDLDCIQVDDASAIGLSWLKDANAEYNVSCRFGETYVSDDNFETRLIALGYDTLPLDDYVLTSNIDALTILDVSGQGIADLTGIEDFIALEVLDCSDNILSDLNINKNVALTNINCSNNDFLNIDFSKNIALTTIDCSNNSLIALDLIANSNLLNLNISNNNFSTFLPSAIPSLEDFNCDNNQLTDLDLSSNSGLTALSCESNSLEILNIKNGQNPSLSNLNAQSNIDLTCIVTDSGNAPGSVTWLKDATTEYEIECHYGETYVPDDSFEQALITKGLDSGVLDDYVLTSNIDNISNLDISNNTIQDLTGLEDFIGLKSLYFSNNDILDVDLSKNVLLEELNASNNALTEIDLSFNLNLEILNISENSFSEVDLNSNTNLLELNVSGNQLTVLNVDVLVGLQELDCSSNELEGLSVELNTQLVNLYCQSNSFISDQLNLQNGANPNLANFNATDNGDLKCILVDDPFTVITNAGGVYDDWFKDFTSNYQSVCIDADNDGVNNEDDLCPNSVFGQPVNLFGCEYLELPNNNFTVLITGETCLNSNNGKINITATEIFNYTATVTSDDFDDYFSTEFKFTNDVEIRNLLAGTYQMCITIEEWPDYISCYDVVINHPEELAVLTNKSNGSKELSLDLSGSANYNIDLNGLTFTTNTNALTLNLNEGENTIKVSTDLECQGVYEEHIFVSNQLFVHPNPFSNIINIYLGDIEDDATVHIHSYLGQLVYSKTFVKQDSQNLNIDTSAFSIGLYSISIQTKASLSTFKIVKK